MSLSKNYATNRTAEVEGVDVPMGTNDDGSVISFKLSRMSKSNKRYTKALEAATKPYRRQIELGVLDETLSEKLFKGVFVDTILLGWQNVQFSDIVGGYNTEKAPFTKENALQLFDRLPELYEDLQQQAQKISLFRDESLEDEAKN